MTMQPIPLPATFGNGSSGDAWSGACRPRSRLLAEAGVPVPLGGLVASAAEAQTAAAALAYPVGVTRLHGSGRGVTADVDRAEALPAAFDVSA